MILENEYYKKTDTKKVKKYGQFFTPQYIADFMKLWVTEKNPKTILDPAVGNGIFLKNLDVETRIGYEIDPEIYEFFKNNIDYEIRLKDYLISEWDEKYDAIICNPPYNKFQTIGERNKIIQSYQEKLKINISGYTNQYIFFLLKSLSQLNENGRMIYIIPNEFLNAGYGKSIKEFLLNNNWLKYIISFSNNISIFEKALTTCCILCIEKNESDLIKIININNLDEFKNINFKELDLFKNIKSITKEELLTSDKWLKYIENVTEKQYNNLIPFKTIAKTMRGIATGDNDYFIFNESKRLKYKLSTNSLYKCITKCSDIKNVIFDFDEFEKLKNNDKNIYIFDGTLYLDDYSQAYIDLGVEQEVNKKYLTSHRNIWYQQENKTPSPIWINVFSRNKLKVIRNLAGINNLTTFHSIYINSDYNDIIDIFFCYLLTPIAQEILYYNKRAYGGGLDKFEPNDLNNASVLNIALLNEEDRLKVMNCYYNLKKDEVNTIKELDIIFRKYV